MTVDRAIIDINDALARALGDAAFLKMMFEELSQTIPGIMSAIETDIQSGDMDQLGKDAHQLKGAASNLSVTTVAALALNLEKIGKNGDPTHAQETFGELKEAIAAFLEQLDAIDWNAVSAQRPAC